MINRVKKFLKVQLKKIYFGQRLKDVPITHSVHPSTPEVEDNIQFFIDTLSRGQIHEHLEVEGWLYSQAQSFNLTVEVNNCVIATFQPDYVRHDVCSVFPDMDQARNTGFKLQLPITCEQFNRRGASEVKLYYVSSSNNKQLLASSAVFHVDSYPQDKPDANKIFYFTIASSNISLGGFGDFKDKLAPFAIGQCQLGFMAPVLYMRSTLGAQHDWQFDPDFDESRKQANGKLVLADSLRSILNYATEHQIPCVIGLNGGIWGDAAGSCPEWDLTDHLEEDEINCQWNQRDKVMPDDYLKHLTGAESAPELSRSLTLNHYNNSVRNYKKRNLQQAGKVIVEFARENPELYLGTNLDPDCYHNPFFEGEQWYDFNPQTLEQFRDWLAGTGVYQHELKHCIQHSVFSLPQLNNYLRTDYQSWSEVEPPRHLHCLPCSSDDKKALTLWEQFKRHLVHRHYTDLSSWLVAVGLPERMIFSSQGFTSPRGRIDPFALQLNSPLKNYDSGGMSLEGSKPEQGHVGAILYGESARNTIQTENQLSFFENIIKLDPDWAVVEFNPADLRDDAQALPSYGYAWECLREVFNHGARFVNLMAWNGSSGKDHGKPGFNAHMALRDTSLEQAVIDFMLLYADIARGEQCYTFGTQRYACSDAWSVSGGKLTPTEQGLQVGFIKQCIELYAPQPYLYSGASFIELDCAGPVNSDLEIKLVVNGVAIDCEQHIQQLAAGDLSRYRLSIKQALPSKIACLTLQVTAHNAVKQLLLHRIVFKRKSSTVAED